MTVKVRRPWSDDGGLSIDVNKTSMHYDPNLKNCVITAISSDGNLHDLEQCIKELREHLGIAS